jgi:2,4-dienoyl-CoA reductase-like NADH-dependent reductase (Old Yellow Enzyme family)
VEAGARGGAFVEVPFDPEETFGSRRPKVRATFDGHPYRGSIAPMGGRPLLGVTRAVRNAIGKDVGDRVAVTVTRDDEPRTVEVPPGLVKALEAAGLRERFDELAYTHRKEYAQWVAEAKREETRARRIAKAVEMVASGRTRS